MIKLTASEIAIKSLKKIEQHEKECGAKWAEASLELKYIKKTLESHSARWERTAWVLITTIGLSLIMVYLK